MVMNPFLTLSMDFFPRIFVFLVHSLLICGEQYEFGLIENTPLLIQLSREDKQLHTDIVQLHKKHNNIELERYLDIVYGNESTEFNQEFIAHPVNAYNLIKRSAVFIKELEMNLRNHQNEEFVKMAEVITDMLSTTLLYKTITTRDMHGAVKALLTIVHTYNMDVEKLRQGILQVNFRDNVGQSYKAETHLGVNDLAVIALASKDRGYINTAVKFARSATKASKEENIKDAEVEKLQKMKINLMLFHNGYLTKRKTYLTDEHVLLPYILDEELERKKSQPKFVRSGDVKKMSHTFSMTHGGWFFDMQRLMDGCRGFDNSKTFETRASGQRCHLTHHRDPYTRLGPFKVEYANQEPLTVVIHGIMEPEDTEHFVKWATPRLSRNRNTNEHEHKAAMKASRDENKVRTIYKSVQAWLTSITWEGEMSGKEDRPAEDFEYTPANFTVYDHRAEKLSRRFELALNLNITNQFSSHTYQVTNYGLGGLCEAHVDPHGYQEGKDISGDRMKLFHTGDYIGTVMGWLGDTQVGGGTSFYKFGSEVTVHPEKGAIAFWFSLDKDGKRDSASNHGGCPVAMGSKWILNKWIYGFNNWHKHPCGTQEGDTKKWLGWTYDSHY